jgi:DNA replication protein DnaC
MSIIKNKLRTFKLAGMTNSLEDRLAYAQKHSLSHAQFLEMLCEDEANNRRDNSYRKKYAKAKLPSHKLIEDFDFNFQPSIDQKQINDLVTCQYIEQKRNVIFIGNPGTGKTHLAIGLGIKALAKHYKVVFTNTAEMLYQLYISKADNSFYRKINEYLSPDLLIIDELGFKAIPEHSTSDFFEVISKRYDKASCIITTNKQLEQWSDIFGDGALSSAISDRLVHHSAPIKISGPSYRAKNIKTNSMQK